MKLQGRMSLPVHSFRAESPRGIAEASSSKTTELGRAATWRKRQEDLWQCHSTTEETTGHTIPSRNGKRAGIMMFIRIGQSNMLVLVWQRPWQTIIQIRLGANCWFKISYRIIATALWSRWAIEDSVMLNTGSLHTVIPLRVDHEWAIRQVTRA